MVYRLPTNHSLVPSPVDQSQVLLSPPVTPWRGSLIVSGTRPSDRAGSQDVRVAALEIDGDSRVRDWPPQFFARVLHEKRVLHEVITHIDQHHPPMCTFVADRHIRDSRLNSANEIMFRNLSRVLYENETVVIVPWGTPALRGAGMIIYPAQNSSSLLVGALFFDRPFPAFLGSSSPLIPFGLAIPAAPPMHPQPHYAQGMVPASSYDAHGQSVSPRRSHPDSPAEAILSHGGPRQDQYQHYMMTYGQGNADSSPASVSSVHWTSEMNFTGGNGSSTQPNLGQYS
ncbi:hypothetical protein AGABI1DRAFT_109620 [Agaricus bisporus var. burnettii JB137-S8]|uniref:Uncharacterized protein n=1 Tax=Agaricus bisporus var. burnettii (strain JB137-S8 / ATCC MYA-4627 / FGSC 10392) TaxID=597362 RepID=K5VLB1_AGABU|nr:uncharacterized protein AGABI1DRAFT_109620 [Agaricus bisporus var. burnettii JB137-S8]EKM75164.1 hypothetical protein AGABI1DRAFT_109620 [Agaricus bisporus var. burnettii JB137-S8]